MNSNIPKFIYAVVDSTGSVLTTYYTKEKAIEAIASYYIKCNVVKYAVALDTSIAKQEVLEDYAQQMSKFIKS